MLHGSRGWHPDGLQLCKNFNTEIGQRIVDARGDRLFTHLEDFCRCTRLPCHLVENVIAASAMDGWGQSRRELFWALGLLPKTLTGLDLSFPIESVTLPVLTDHEQASMEVAMTGLSTCAHPMQTYRPMHQQHIILSSIDLSMCPAGKQVRTAGLAVIHQAPPTAKGYRFLTLEDEFGFINVIVRPKVYAQFRLVVREQPLLLVIGEVQHESGVTNLVASQLHPLAQFVT